MKKIAIISTYNYDDPMTDMACAWYTVYTYIDIETGEITREKVGSGWGEKFEPNAEIVPMTDEIKALYHKSVAARIEKRAAECQAKYNAEVEAYNASRRVQKVGQIVEVTSGKYKGIKGKVTWVGKSQFGGTTRKSNMGWRASAILAIANYRPYTIPCANENLVLVRPLVYGDTFANGKDKLYINIDNCKVIEGFTPIEVSLDACKSYVKNTDDMCRNLHDGYDYHSYV
jgi:hypothetical protein